MLRLGEECAQGQRLSPAGVGHDDIRDEAGSRQRRERVEHLFGAPALHVEAAREGVDGSATGLAHAVFEEPDTVHPTRRLRADRRHGHAGVARQRVHDMLVLRRKVVVNE